MKVFAKRSLPEGGLPVWGVGLFSLVLWLAFVPHLALEQARQLAACLAGLCFLHILSAMDRSRKWLAHGRESWLGDVFHGSTA